MGNYVNYCISLIGTNPLPVFITILKNCNKNTNIYLVHTTESRINFGSKIMAENLKKVVEEKIAGANVNLIPCDKSNTKNITECITELIRDIKNSIKENQNYKLILDYTGGTKVMSALFAERIYNLNTEGLTFVISYVDDNQKKIFEDSRFVDENRVFEIKNVANKLNMSIEEITRIHGYKLERRSREKVYKGNVKYLEILNSEHSENSGPIVFINEDGVEILVNEVYLLNGRLIFGFESKYLGENKKKSTLKKELFELKDKANKLGGDRSGILYKCDYDKEKERDLRKDLRGAYEFEMEKRLEFIFDDNSFKDRIEQIYINEGGD